MPKRLEEIFNTKDIDGLDSGVLFKGVMNHVDELSNEEFSRALELLPLDAKLLAMKERCKKTNDTVACMTYDIAIHGDPSAPVGTPKHLGLEGLWYEKRNAEARKSLERVGEL